MAMQRIYRSLASWRCFGQFYFFFDVGSIWTKHWKTCTKSLITCLLWGLSQFVVRVGGLVIDKSIVYMMQICIHALTQFVQICPKLSKVWTMDKYTIFSMRVNKNWILIVLDNWTILDNFISSQKWWFIFIWYPCSTMFPHYVYKIWKQMWVFLQILFLKNDSTPFPF